MYFPISLLNQISNYFIQSRGGIMQLGPSPDAIALAPIEDLNRNFPWASGKIYSVQWIMDSVAEDELLERKPYL